MKFFTVIPSKAKRSRGCNAADEVREARLSIPLKGPAVVPRDPSTSLGMTRGTALAFFLCINFAITSAALAQADAEFAKANQEFAQGHFKEAISGYEALIRAGQWSANVFYDLGNAHFRTGDFGRAILNYERALALERHHPEATANLQIARDEARALELQQSWPERYLRFASVNQYSIAAAVAFWLGAFCTLALIFARRRSARLIALSILSFSVCALAILATYEIDYGSKGRGLAIITGDNVQARLATADTANSA